jgi:predicted ATPase
MSDRFVVLSGCSGGGKSTLLAELRRRGHAGVEEPGRRIVREQLARGGTALPWLDMAGFARRAIAVARADRPAADACRGWVFFDRGLVDAASALEHATSRPVLQAIAAEHRYHSTVFLTPPWPEIFVSDPERRHGLENAIAEYERLVRAYRALDYTLVVLPRTSVAERADLVLQGLQSRAGVERLDLP